MSDIPLTEERVVPDLMTWAEPAMAEHLARYLYAAHKISHLGGQNLHVLDAPSGAGYGTALLAGVPSVKQVVGIDIDPAAVAYAKKRHGRTRATYEVCDMAALAGRTDKFDAVVCFEGIEHVKNLDVCAFALCNSLKPGGLLMVSTPRRGGPGAGSPFHTKELSIEEFANLFRKNLSNYNIIGQDLLVGDIDARSARYFILIGTR